ncbi:VOC family protein [Candidatus Gottesmanbacteria bacterium]|nr:VOC family protein [Candidatus Gottesmanbacteria bacterium]
MDSVVHFEIPADDTARAQKFYHHVFGWNIVKAPMPGMEYFMVTTTPTDDKQVPAKPGAINGGMQKRTAPGESPVLVVSVTNLDEALVKATVSGAVVVMPKMQVADMGLYARITDTEGNTIGLWQDLKK